MELPILLHFGINNAKFIPAGMKSKKWKCLAKKNNMYPVKGRKVTNLCHEPWSQETFMKGSVGVQHDPEGSSEEFLGCPLTGRQVGLNTSLVSQGNASWHSLPQQLVFTASVYYSWVLYLSKFISVSSSSLTIVHLQFLQCYKCLPSQVFPYAALSLSVQKDSSIQLILSSASWLLFFTYQSTQTLFANVIKGISVSKGRLIQEESILCDY